MMVGLAPIRLDIQVSSFMKILILKYRSKPEVP